MCSRRVPVALFSLLVGLATVRCNGDTIPGIKIGLSNAGMQYALSVAVPIIEHDAKDVSVPDIHGSAGTPVGSVDYDITAIKANSASIGSSSLSASTAGIALSLSSVSVALNADWHYREHSWPHVSDSGSVDISVSGTSLSTTIAIGVTNGSPSLSVASCSSNIGSVDLSFHGGASWLYNLFKSPIENAVKNALNGQLCSIISTELPAANAALAKLPMNYTIDHGVVVSYALTSTPTVSADFLITSHQGILYPPNYNGSIPVPYVGPTVPVPAALPKMFYVWVTTLIADTAAWAYQEAGVLDIRINASQIPASSPFQLNTSSFADIIPPLQQKYPNQLMSVALVANPKPILTKVIPSDLNLQFNFNFEFYVVSKTPNASDTLVFTLNTTSYAAGNASVHSVSGATTLNFDVLFINMNVSLVQSSIGRFDPTEFQTLLNFLVTGFLIPKVNTAGQKGIFIPTIDGVSLVGPQVVFGDDFIRIDSDVHYNSTAAHMQQKLRAMRTHAAQTASL